MAANLHFDQNQMANFDAACLTEEMQRLFIQMFDMPLKANVSANAAVVRQKVSYLILANLFDDQVEEVLRQRELDGGGQRPRDGGSKAAALVTTALVDLYHSTGGALRRKRRCRMGPRLLVHNQLSIARRWRHMVEELGHGVVFFDPNTQPTVHWLERQTMNVRSVFAQMTKHQLPTTWKQAGERCWKMINEPEAVDQNDLDKLENVEYVAGNVCEENWSGDDGNAGGKVHEGVEEEDEDDE
ncbi:hypothetical protein IWX90DRAFT_491147 [Phyllosticta citrichinensis]|uniref:Uncharacterized protein n=1 Tax=Phyllosticta citrichinensis TaxID=1130410 RepID=A0ABR1Y4W9_9PEZI